MEKVGCYNSSRNEVAIERSSLERGSFSCARNFRVVAIAIGSCLYTFFNRIIDKVRAFAAWLFRNKVADRNKIVSSKQPIPYYYREWMQNLALMRELHARTTDPKVKELLEFMVANYLYGSAPIPIDQMRRLGALAKVDKYLHVTPQILYSYHRYAFIENLKLAENHNQRLVMAKTSPLIPTDTKDYAELLPLSFTVLNSSNRHNWPRIIRARLEKHFKTSGFNEKFHQSFLLDTTELLGRYIKIDDKEAFNSEYKIIKLELNRAIELAISELPQLKRHDLLKFIRSNLTGIVRFDMDKFAGVKVLPLFDSKEANQFIKRHSAFSNFLCYSGVYIGSVNMRRYLSNPMSNYQDVQLEITGIGSKSMQVKKISDTQMFKRIKRKLESSSFSAVQNLGLATLKLIGGLEEKVSYDDIPRKKREILAQVLFQLQLHLAKIEENLDSKFVELTSSVKLVHFDLMNLLEITRPYKREDFEQIYLRNLSGIEGYSVQAGLGKTGMNVYAGINKAIFDGCMTKDQPVRAFGKGLYFETVGFIGEDHSLEDVLKDPSVKKIDLLVCQFNPNMDLASDFTHYEVGDIAGDIRKILHAKPDTNKLTVAIDCTIDYVNSEKVQQLLSQFKKEILEGRINFVLFRSGQKFDMFGMDNYYGAPYVIVNNGGASWDSFNALLEGKAFETDGLSSQWFCLANEFAFKELEQYRDLIFQNTKSILKDLPDQLKTTDGALRINSVSDEMEVCFIDIKVMGRFHHARAQLIIGDLYSRYLENGLSIGTRASFGFAHANVVSIKLGANGTSTSIRINPGIDPRENRIMREFLISLSNRL